MADNTTSPVVSGPTSYSKRTDLAGSTRTTQGSKQFIADSYGDATDMANIQAAAAMNATPSPAAVAQQSPVTPQNVAEPVNLFAPTARTSEPITSGVDVGPGVGSSALGAGYQPKLSDTLAKMLPYDTTGEISALYNNALAKGM